jgi:hypothetical protein
LKVLKKRLETSPLERLVMLARCYHSHTIHIKKYTDN